MSTGCTARLKSADAKLPRVQCSHAAQGSGGTKIVWRRIQIERRSRFTLHMTVLTSALFFVGCENKDREKAEDVCNSGHTILLCEADLFEDSDDEFTKECLGNVEAAGEVGEVCEESLISPLNCLGDLACMDIETSRDDKCGEVTVDYCGPDAADFCEQCPGVWYAEGESVAVATSNEAALGFWSFYRASGFSSRGTSRSTTPAR